MNLSLNRPICFIDLETTGVNVATDRIVEIAILKIHPEGKQDIYSSRINPTIPIPAVTSAIHHIFDEDVVDAPTFKELAPTIAGFIGSSDLGGYNSNKFDIPLLVEEFLRAEFDFEVEHRKLVDVQNIFHKMEQRTLVAAYKFYCGKELTDAHAAENDIRATYEVLEAQLDKYPDLNPSVDFLDEFSAMNKNVDLAGRIVYNAKNEEVFNFGKHKGKRVEDVFKREPSYYSWMMDGDFPMYTKKVLTRIKLRSFNQ